MIVAGLDERCPAREAGVQERDRIMAVGGQQVTALTDEDLPDIRRMMALVPVGAPMQLDLQRGGRTERVKVTPRLKGKVEGDELDCPRWDLTVKAINQFDNQDLYFHRKEGVFIFGVEYPGNASQARLMRKDILLEIDGQEVKTLADVRRIYEQTVAQVDTRSRALVTVMRNGLTRQAVLEFSRDYDRE